MSDELMRREVQEAIDAGERALGSLREADRCLGSARNWGIWDLLGGGMIVSAVKHSKISNASSYLEEARRDVQIFQRELKDVQGFADLRLEIGDFLTFADFFFDGLVADYLVQSKIADARRQVAEAIARIERMLSDLRSYIV